MEHAKALFDKSSVRDQWTDNASTHKHDSRGGIKQRISSVWLNCRTETLVAGAKLTSICATQSMLVICRVRVMPTSHGVKLSQCASSSTTVATKSKPTSSMEGVDHICEKIHTIPIGALQNRSSYKGSTTSNSYRSDEISGVPSLLSIRIGSHNCKSHRKHLCNHRPFM